MVICNDLFVVGWFAEMELQPRVIWWYQLQGCSVTEVSDNTYEGTAKWVRMFSLRVLEVSLSVCERLGFMECALGSAGFSWQVSTGFELRLSQVCIFRSSDSPGEPWNETLVSPSLCHSHFSTLSLSYHLTNPFSTEFKQKTRENGLRRYSNGICCPWSDSPYLIIFLCRFFFLFK